MFLLYFMICYRNKFPNLLLRQSALSTLNSVKYLVHANYRNVHKNIEWDMNFLNLFFRDWMIGEHNELKNRYMVVNPHQQSLFFCSPNICNN